MVQKIKFNGKQHPITISYYALKHTAGETGKKLTDLGNLSDDPETYESLLYHGLRAGANIENEEFNYRREDMEMILDQCFFEFIDVIKKAFPSKENEVAVESGDKKKGKPEKK